MIVNDLEIYSSGGKGIPNRDDMVCPLYNPLGGLYWEDHTYVDRYPNLYRWVIISFIITSGRLALIYIIVGIVDSQ